MPPKAALLICVVLILAFFVVDKKRNSTTSWDLWIPLCWLLIAASRPIALWLNPGGTFDTPDDLKDSSLIDRVFLICIIAGGGFILLKRKLQLSLLIKQNIWVFLFFLYCALSILWSDFPVATFNAWVKMSVTLLMALVITTHDNPVDALRTILRRATFVLIPLSVVLIKFFPIYGRSYSRWTGTPFFGGVTIFKNGLGLVCLVFGLFLVWDIISEIRSRNMRESKISMLVNASLIAITIWLLILSECATAFGAFIIGSAIIIILEFPFFKNKLKYLNIAVLIVVIIAVLSLFLLNTFEDLVHGLGRDMTLTGRTVIWKRVLSVEINPLIGTGYSSFWYGSRAASLIDLNSIPLTQAHNGYIEIYLNLGYVGLFLLVMLIGKTYSNAKHKLLDDFQYGKFCFVFFVVVLIGNITEASFATNTHFWFIFVMISVDYGPQISPDICTDPASRQGTAHQ